MHCTCNMLCRLQWTEVALQFCDETKVLLIYSATVSSYCLSLMPIYHAGKAYELIGYRASNAIKTTHTAGCDMAFSPWLPQ